MILFISDLHFIDETAGMHNIPARASEGVFEDIRNYGGNPPGLRLFYLVIYSTLSGQHTGLMCLKMRGHGVI